MTPLAGAPIRIVRALNRHTDIAARLINHNPSAYGTRTFDEDINFKSAPEESRELIASADLIHCHHWIDLASNPFGVDLRKKHVLRHFHSEPHFVAKHANVAVADIVGDERPQLVVAQFQERYYPRAKPVPNLLDLEALDRIAADTPRMARPTATVRLAYAPTTDVSAFSERWNTKGAPETLRILERMRERLPLTIDVFHALPHAEAMRRKFAADIVIDELVTGSYHLSGLESMAMGLTTLGYLDARTTAVVAALTGSMSLPWINVPLHAAPECLETLIDSSELRTFAGAAGMHWIRNNWDTQKLIRHYVEAYDDVLNGRPLVRSSRVNELNDIAIPDYNWRTNIKQLERCLNEG